MIRQANSIDLSKISVMGEAFLKDSISSKFLSFDFKNFHEMLLNMINAGILTVWVADENGIVGAAGLIITPNFYNHTELLGDIYFIDVVPEYRKKGIANDLMQTAENYAKEKKCIAITVSFNHEEIADKIISKRDYQKLEYKIIKKLR